MESRDREIVSLPLFSTAECNIAVFFRNGTRLKSLIWVIMMPTFCYPPLPLRQGKHYKTELDGFENPVDIPRLYSVGEATARKIYNFCKKEGRDEKLKAEDSHKELICDIIDEDCTRSIQQVCNILFDRTNLRISRSTENRCLKEFHYSLKMIKLIPKRRNDPITIEIRKEYAIIFLRMAPDSQKIIFLDETGFQVNMVNKCGRSMKGVSNLNGTGPAYEKLFHSYCYVV
ncbi:hypothetical protein RF11_14316 [Thelohanellus kitauei]|uniref:Tc1-like transposase DDE domain-containing protein n=1 Tax=Thelohanellus kitauei TaxID=669202 RepID=A0A0C2N131_THEKT|nr:hypothetical protein RF11_14316 [Thelohanellus kitauei]